MEGSLRGLPGPEAGGRFVVSDIVASGEIPEETRRSMKIWVGCVAGALEEEEFECRLLEVV